MNSPDGITSTSELQTAVLEDGQIINVIDNPGISHHEELDCIGLR